MFLLSYEEFREIIAKANKQGTNIPHYLLGNVRLLQLCLKNFQEKGLLSLDGSFNYLSMDGSDFRNFWKYPDCIVQISNG